MRALSGLPIQRLKQGLTGTLRNTLLSAIFGALCSALLLVLLVQLMVWQAKTTLQQQMQQQLPGPIEAAFHNSHGGQTELFSAIRQKLNTDLQTIPNQQTWSLIAGCQAQVVSLLDEPMKPSSLIRLQWSEHQQQRQLWYQSNCQLNKPVLFVLWLCLLPAVLLCCSLLPVIVQPKRWRLLRQLQQLPLSVVAQRAAERAMPTNWTMAQQQLFQQLCLRQLCVADAMVLCEQPKAADFCLNQIDWLVLGWQQLQSAAKAFAVAECAPGLQFDPINHQLWVHGLPLQLAKTPFLYFYWYAKARAVGEGWLLNPASNKPDQQAAQQLIMLMQQYQGHGKAISDLSQQGLKAKTLDQNRSKIRDELIRQLGPELAKPYLFVSEKDGRSGRFRYRLALASDQIVDLASNTNPP